LTNRGHNDYRQYSVIMLNITVAVIGGRAEYGVWRFHLALPAGEVAHLFAERRGAQLSHLLSDVRRRAGRAAPAAETLIARPVQC